MTHQTLNIGRRLTTAAIVVGFAFLPSISVDVPSAAQGPAKIQQPAAVVTVALSAPSALALPAGARQSPDVVIPAAEATAISTPSCRDGVLPAAKIKAMIEAEAAKLGADARLATAISEQESGFGQNNNSPAGARGPMQLIASTAAQYGVTDICDSVQNIRGGISFMRDLNVEFGGNILLIVAAYNAGQKRVYQAKGIPPIPETVNYVARVTNSYYNFDNALHGGKRSRGSAVDMAANASSAPETSSPKTDGPKVNATRSKTGGQWVGSVFYVDQRDDK
jgi:soluble lytic murein transglycosylase-like protein